MKLFASVIALSVLAGGAAYAHPQAAVVSAAPAGHEIMQPRGETSHNVPLYYVKSEDVSPGQYWTTPKELGGGLEQGRALRESAY